jgi:ABC-2 type transport system ATP-binding protein
MFPTGSVFMAVNVIETNGLVRKFGDLTAVNNVTFKVKKGIIFGLLGPNGAGKTTLLRILTGQLEPTTGKATVMGLDPTVEPLAVKNKVGIVPEVESPPSFLTAKEYLHYIGLIRNLEGIEEKTDHWIDFLDMTDVHDVMGKDMSKGTRQKLMLAAAFIHKPPLLFLDEPFIGLDPYHQKQIREYLEGYLTNGGTIFMCTHILEIAEKMCTKIAIINKGKIVAKGSVSELTKKDETLSNAFMRYIGKV